MQNAEKPPALGVVTEPLPPVDTKPPALGVVWTTSDAITDGPSTVEAIERHERAIRWRNLRVTDAEFWERLEENIRAFSEGLPRWSSVPTPSETSDAEMTAFLRGAF